jgi:hypothetical protein
LFVTLCSVDNSEEERALEELLFGKQPKFGGNKSAAAEKHVQENEEYEDINVIYYSIHFLLCSLLFFCTPFTVHN